jgi:hypothetical protein
LYAIDLAPAATKATDYNNSDDGRDVYPLGVCLPPTAVYAGGEQALAIVTGTLKAIEAGPTVDLLEIYAAEELAQMRRQADGDEPREVEQITSPETETADGGADDEADDDDDTVTDDEGDAASRDEL